MTPSCTFDPVACDREPIHIPGAIQPHGVLLVVEPRSGRILQVAGDAEALVGVPAHALLGAPLAMLGDKLAGLVGSGAAALERPVTLGSVSPSGPGLPSIDLTLHWSDKALLLEIEPSGPGGDLTRMLGRLQGIHDDLQAASDLWQVLGRAAEHVRALTGFDRVMIYRFLPDGCGVVSAEACEAGFGGFLNHRFPESDIPAQARALYVRNRIRVIPDVNYVPAPLVPLENPLTGGPLDLSDSLLRSVSPVHVQYLRNMEVGASMSLSVVIDGDLWGLIACHHREALPVPLEVRAGCTEIARTLSYEVRVRDEDLHHRQSARLRAGAELWLGKAAERGVKPRLSEDLKGLFALLPCDGIAVISGSTVRKIGRTPDEKGLRRLLPWLLDAEEGSCRATDHLAGIDPAAATYAAAASGALGVVLAKADPVAVLWFRAEHIQTIEWAGDPNKSEDSEEPGFLTPRRSFQTWKELVHQRSRAWTEPEKETGVLLARRMVALYQVEKLGLLKDELERRITRQNELATQVDLLVREMNDRVEDSLQTVMALLHVYSEVWEDAEGRSRFEEVRRGIMAVSRIHQRLGRAKSLEGVPMGPYLAGLRDELAAAWGSEWNGAVTVEADDIAVPVVSAALIALVVTELLTNAVNHAYGGEAGPVEVRLERLGADRGLLIVRDHGLGMAAPAEGGAARQGSGSRLTQAMAARLGGALQVVSSDAGTIVQLELPLSGT